MRAVDPAYNAYPDTRRVDIDIRFLLVDPDAAGNATATATEKIDAISDASQILDPDNAPTEKWATLEPGLWRLDGTWDILPDDATDIPIGLWTVVSGAQGGFLFPPPELVLTLSEPATSAGFELFFDDRAQLWAATVVIKVYDSQNTLITSGTFFPTGPRFQAALPAENYSRVVMTFNGTPTGYRRVRLYSVLFGIGEYFTKSNTITATWSEGAALAAERFPARQIIFTFDNADHRYNFLNPTGLFGYLQDGQTIESSIIIDGYAVDMGEYFFQTGTAKDSGLTAEITASDKSYWLDMEVYNNGTSGDWTVAEALADVLGESWDFDGPSAVLETTIRTCIPMGTTKREAVRLIAQAAMCAVYVDRDGTLILDTMGQGGTAVDTLDDDNMPSMDGISVGDRVDSVVLKVKDDFDSEDQGQEYTAGSGGVTWTVSNPLVAAVDGPTVAAWLLAQKQRYLKYKLQNRGNPAVEIGDTVTVENAFDVEADAVITGIELSFNGGLTETTEATE